MSLATMPFLLFQSSAVRILGYGGTGMIILLIKRNTGPEVIFDAGKSILMVGNRQWMSFTDGFERESRR